MNYTIESIISIFMLIIAFAYLIIYNYEKAYNKEYKRDHRKILFIITIILFVLANVLRN